MLKMLVQRLLVLSTFLLSALSTPVVQYEQSVADWDTFHSLLNDVDSGSIHSALYSLAPKYKDGIFEKERTAIEQVHSENPAIASKLVKLAKRQSNTTTTTTTTSDTSSVVPSSTTSDAVVSTTTSKATTSAAATSTTAASTTASASNAAESSSLSSASVAASSASKASASSASKSAAASISSTLSSEIHASTKPPVTTIVVAPSAPKSATAIATESNAVVYSYYGGGLVTVTSQDERVSFTQSTSTHLLYTTAPDGSVSTSTDVVVVNAPVTTNVGAATGTDAAAATTSSPGLQSAAASFQPVFLGPLSAVLAGAIGLAMLIL